MSLERQIIEEGNYDDPEYAASEGRDFLITVVLDDDYAGESPDEKDDEEIISWLEELGYQWNGASWIAN